MKRKEKHKDCLRLFLIFLGGLVLLYSGRNIIVSGTFLKPFSMIGGIGMIYSTLGFIINAYPKMLK